MKIPKHRRDAAALNSRLIRRPIQRVLRLFLLPTFAAFCIGFLYPFFKGLFLSFCKFTHYQPVDMDGPGQLP